MIVSGLEPTKKGYGNPGELWRPIDMETDGKTEKDTRRHTQWRENKHWKKIVLNTFTKVQEHTASDSTDEANEIVATESLKKVSN